MTDVIDLDPEGRQVHPHPRVSLRTRGLTGRVQVHESQSQGIRGAEGTRTALIAAMIHNDVAEDLTVEITEQREESPSRGSRAAGGSDDIQLEVRDPGEAFRQFVLYESEDGVLSWHMPQQRGPHKPAIRGSGTLTYRIPRLVVRVAPEEADGHRGILGAAGKKILKILVFRLVREGAKWVGERYGEKVELPRRPHRLRTFLPGEHRAALPAELSNEQLRALGDGRALLFVHGTFSTAHNAFGRLDDQHMRALHTRYQGRLFAFDHPTISMSPAENVAWLAKRLTDAGARLDLDLISHSRGGLLGRVLTERPDLYGLGSDRLRVNRLVMVAAPNAGTVLVDIKHLEQLLNRFTNLLQLVPDNGVTDVLDMLLAVLKQVAAGVAEGLDGLTSMNPTGVFLNEILDVGTNPAATYFAAAANFEPPKGSKLLRIARDAGTDLVFGNTHNDLVVPTEGVFKLARSGGAFPIANPLIFEGGDAVDHSGFWLNERFTDNLLSWLPGTN